MCADTTKAVTKTASTAVVEAGPSALGRGFEGVDMTKVSMPRVKVMQGLSPELQEEDYDFRQGDIIHGLLMEKMPDKFTPIKFWDSRILFIPRNDGEKKELIQIIRDMFNVDVSEVGTIICKADDNCTGSRFGNCAACPLGQWQEDTPPMCTQTINVLALFEGNTMPVVIPFFNTSHKYGRKFRDMAIFSGGDAFTRKYKLAAKREQNEKGIFFTSVVKPAGFPTDDEQRLAEAMYNKFSGVIIETDIQDDGAEAQETDF